MGKKIKVLVSLIIVMFLSCCKDNKKVESDQKDVVRLKVQTKLDTTKVGNKFYTLIKKEWKLEGNIHKAIAQSFIGTAQQKGGILDILANKQLNFNKDGEYNLRSIYLDMLYKRMNSIGAKFIKYSFVEIDKTQAAFQNINLTTTFSANNSLYIILSLADINGKIIDDNSYIILDAKPGLKLDDLKISDSIFSNCQNKFINGGYMTTLNNHFSYNGLGNTQAISYYIGDVEDLLKSNSREYTIYLSEITDVKKMTDTNPDIEIWPSVYERHFKDRVKQVTLVFKTLVNDYYDMGQLEP